MSTAATTKLTPALKSLISSPLSRPNPLPSPSTHLAQSLFSRISSKGDKHGVGMKTILTLGTASLFTVNCPGGVRELYDFATKGKEVKEKAGVASIMRETGLKCISFSGIPRTINNLGALTAHLEDDVKALLSTEGTRQPTPQNIESISTRALSLWNSIYDPHSSKLLSKLSSSHPDLPIHILNSHYGALLSDPPESSRPDFPGHAKIGRILTSIVAISCLRAQTGVGPQVTSHVFGLKKALLDGEIEGEEVVGGQDWLTSDEGCEWILNSVDEIVEGVNPSGVVSFAGGREKSGGGEGEVKARL